MKISYLSPHRQVISPHRQLLPRQFGVWNYWLTCAAGNRSPVTIIGFYKHKVSSYPLKYETQYTLATEPQKRLALRTHLSSFLRGTFVRSSRRPLPKLALTKMRKSFPSWKVDRGLMDLTSFKRSPHMRRSRSISQGDLSSETNAKLFKINVLPMDRMWRNSTDGPRARDNKTRVRRNLGP